MYSYICIYAHWGPVILTNFLKIGKLSVVLGWQKIYMTVLEKAFFFILCVYILFWFLYRKIKKMAPLRSENFSFK